MATTSASLYTSIAEDGFVFVHGQPMRELLAPFGPFADWPAFAGSWNRLDVDTYMADGGRYRRRRHAVYAAHGTAITREPHQPHFQPIDYNPLNGGVERWFTPVEPEVGSGGSMTAVLAFCHSLFGSLAPAIDRWHIEVHQFRIEARGGDVGRPTPEGLHRDGVDYVLVLLVNRENIASGVTTIHTQDGRPLGHFTLTHPFDAALVDDGRVAHGVTPVVAIDATRPAHRDVLVVTFRRQ